MTITKILLDLFNSDWRVRRTVAENTNCPIETLIELAKDSKLWVRQAVGENANFPTS